MSARDLFSIVGRRKSSGGKLNNLLSEDVKENYGENYLDKFKNFNELSDLLRDIENKTESNNEEIVNQLEEPVDQIEYLKIRLSYLVSMSWFSYFIMIVEILITIYQLSFELSRCNEINDSSVITCLFPFKLKETGGYFNHMVINSLLIAIVSMITLVFQVRRIRRMSNNNDSKILMKLLILSEVIFTNLLVTVGSDFISTALFLINYNKIGDLELILSIIDLILVMITLFTLSNKWGRFYSQMSFDIYKGYVNSSIGKLETIMLANMYNFVNISNPMYEVDTNMFALLILFMGSIYSIIFSLFTTIWAVILILYIPCAETLTINRTNLESSIRNQVFEMKKNTIGSVNFSKFLDDCDDYMIDFNRNDLIVIFES